MSSISGRTWAVIGGVAAATYLALMAPGVDLGAAHFWVGIVAKPIPALCLMGWLIGREAFGTGYGKAIAVGLGLSGLADVLIEPAGDMWFIAGLVTFLLAHVAYLVAYLIDNRDPAIVRVLPFVAWVGGLYAYLFAGLGGMKIPVAVYCLVIGAMMWRAAARVGADGASTRAEWVGLAGAVAFGASDSLIALNRFDAPIELVGYPIMILYWLGQLGIARSTDDMNG